ncbi:hypothetical protein [Bacillus altitudinis]|uniref:hypothetical protein n=1 Tax=Bacillus TaxID=1386 RepID=UPI002ACDB739|nr:hypothetical protein [Bacillus altitudinis]WQH37814.1 hypothetical protein U2873_13375 [Bacillus altitudinis]
MNKIYESKIWRNISFYKTLHFIVYTWILTTIFNNIADKELTKFLNANNETIYTYNYSFGATGLILVIPAALLGLFIVIVLVKIRDRLFPKLNTLKAIGFILKLIKLLWKAVLYVGSATLYLIFLITAFLSKSGGSTSSDRGSYRKASVGGSNNSNSREKLKKEAEWKARQLQKEADYAYKHAGKQAQYNINSSHFDSKLNRANAKQHEANKAAKRARNL